MDGHWTLLLCTVGPLAGVLNCMESLDQIVIVYILIYNIYIYISWDGMCFDAFFDTLIELVRIVIAGNRRNSSPHVTMSPGIGLCWLPQP